MLDGYILSPGKQLLLGDWLDTTLTTANVQGIVTLDDLQIKHIIHVLDLSNAI